MKKRRGKLSSLLVPHLEALACALLVRMNNSRSHADKRVYTRLHNSTPIGEGHEADIMAYLRTSTITSLFDENMKLPDFKMSKTKR